MAKLLYVLSKFFLLPCKIIIDKDFYNTDDCYVVVANHTSLIDGILLTFLMKGKLSFVMEQNLFRYKIIKILSRTVEFIPRTAYNSLTLIRACNRILQANKSIVIFPEGRINVGHEDLTWKNGAVFISNLSGKKILPISIYNADKVWNAFSYLPIPGTIYVKIFQPIQIKNGYSISDIKNLITKHFLYLEASSTH